MLSPFLQKLLFVNQFHINEGKIEILGGRYIMLNASHLLFLQEIDKTKMYAGMKNAAQMQIQEIVEHAQVYKGIKDESLKNIAELTKQIGNSEEGAIRTLQRIFDLYGLGSLEIIDLDNENKRAILRVSDSTIAREQLKKGKSKNPVCTITAGVLAGIFSYIFEEDLDCIEKVCLAKQGGFCEFEVS